ncbi:MAG: hypothetical protein IBX64_11755 [Actinobacteria bacterium]|nr:hypothetical protein [Actinomycetota bacterium]
MLIRTSYSVDGCTDAVALQTYIALQLKHGPLSGRINRALTSLDGEYEPEVGRASQSCHDGMT